MGSPGVNGIDAVSPLQIISDALLVEEEQLRDQGNGNASSEHFKNPIKMGAVISICLYVPPSGAKAFRYAYRYHGKPHPAFAFVSATARPANTQNSGVTPAVESFVSPHRRYAPIARSRGSRRFAAFPSLPIRRNTA